MDSNARKMIFSWIDAKNDDLFNSINECDTVNNPNSKIRYACTFCFGIFNTSDLLIKHMHVQHIALFYLCIKCDSGFSSRDKLLEHAATHANRNLREHNSLTADEVTIEKRYLACATCPRYFSRPSQLRLHAKSHLLPRPCRGRAVDLRNPRLRNDDANHSYNFFDERVENVQGRSKNEEIFDGEDTLCGNDDSDPKSNGCLEANLKAGYFCSTENSCRSKANCNSNLKNNLPSNPSQPSSAANHYLCIFCLKGFTDRQSLEAHEATHSNDADSERPCSAVCNFCGALFGDPKEHDRICVNGFKFSAPVDDSIPDGPLLFDESNDPIVIKTELDSSLCKDEDLSLYVASQVQLVGCEEARVIKKPTDVISRFDEIRRGRRKIPEGCFVQKFESRKRSSDAKGIPSYICHQCLKGFRSKIKFLNHYFEHDKSVKLFSCLACDARFGYSSSMPKHMEMHMRDLGLLGPKKSLNLCPKCGKYYRDLASLKRHEAMVHLKVGHLCMECNRNFSSPQALKQHRRQHAGEYIYKCDLCNKKYANPSSLHNHKKTHSENKLVCNLCSRVFSLKHHLTRHLARHVGFSAKRYANWS